MRPFVILLISLLCTTMGVQAQTYLEHLQKQEPGKGKVTVNQSKAIDELVNGKTVAKEQQTANGTTAETNQKVETKQKADQKPKTESKAKAEVKHDATVKHEAEPKHDVAAKHTPTTEKKAENNKEELETPAVDMSKKVMRGSYKVTGYRVQAYAGGNSRADRQKAEQIGNAIKMKYPKEPVYVHFYSPRWICRVGNYRTLAEAQTMLQKIKAMGYKQACLVKGKITVQD